MRGLLSLIISGRKLKVRSGIVCSWVVSMDFFHSTLHPEADPDLARARAQTIATSILIIDAAVNTLALLFFSFRPCSSSRNPILAFAIARSVYLMLFLGAWLYLRLRIISIERRVVRHPDAVRQWICRLPGYVSLRLRGVFMSRKSQARNYFDDFLHSETAYRPTLMLQDRQCALETPDKECDVPAARADCPTGEDQVPSSRDFPATQVHTLNESGRPSRSGHSSSIGRSPQSKDQQAAGSFPFQDTKYANSEELSAGDVETLDGAGTLKDPFQDHDTELEGEEEEEEVHYRPGADRYVQYSIADAHHDEAVRSAIVEQARRHPARHLATSRELLYRRTYSPSR
ncbi:hypothetical protein F4824DRAFT_15506 [Ustulina deusta]|nr:hypothetical protein F4824DRAFT_15506 [Ustulina deusta]